MGKTKNRNGLALAIIAIGTVSLAGLGIYASNSKKPTTPTKVEVASPQEKPAIQVDVQPDDERDQVSTLQPRFEGDELRFDKSKQTPPAGVDPKVWAVNQYLRAVSAVPKEAKALSCSIDNSIATLDFSKEIEAGYGTMDEMTLVNGVLTVMSQFPGVTAVKFTVEGKTIESLGNIELTDPQRVLKMD